MIENRRSFLRRTGAVLPTWWGGARVRAADDRGADPPASAVEVRRVAADRFELVFKPPTPRPFRILQITDTHFGNPDAVKKASDERTSMELPKLVRAVQPDFVMHTGDFIDNDVEGATHSAFDLMHGLGVPWALAPGNHDGATATTLTAHQYRQRMTDGHGLAGAIERNGKSESVCRLDLVHPGTAPAPTLIASLFVFDSGPTGGAKNVSPGQLAWFNDHMEADRSRGTTTPVLAMIHIPVIEFEQLRHSGRYADRFGEDVCFETDTGKTFETLKKSGRVTAIFSGHDHENTFHGAWDGIDLVYGRVTGWSGYGTGPRGGRLIKLDPDSGRHHHQIVLPEPA